MDFVDILFLLAVVALQHSVFLVNDVEQRVHRLVVGYTLWVVALDDALQEVGSDDGFLLNHFIVAYDVENNVWGKYRQA